MRAMQPTRTGRTDNGGIGVGWEEYGAGDVTLLFLPTWSIIHSRHWKAQIPYFAEHFRCITFDPRGNGSTDRPSTVDGYAFERLVDDARAVLDATDTKAAVVLGYSMGSAQAFGFAAAHPERTLAVVSSATSTPIVPPFDYRNHSVRGTDGVPYGWDKANPTWWRENYDDWLKFFFAELNNEPHSTKQLEDALRWAEPGDGDMLAMTVEARPDGWITEDVYKACKAPCLLIHAENDVITPPDGSRRIAELTGGELIIAPKGGHPIHARFPAWFNVTVRDFLAKHLGTHAPKRRRARPGKRVLYLSSPIGLGHARRDLAVSRGLRKLHGDLQVDWLAQDPVTRFLAANDETVHAASRLLANESAHIEDESGEHDLNAFEAIRRMDEILIKNFMVFQEVLEEEAYDLVIADEAWDVDHYWHEHPNLKKAPVAWMTDFVGWIPFEHNGPREAFLTTDYNAEMIGHVERNPTVRDRAIFVGGPEDIVDLGFGKDLPQMRDWIPKHYDFSDYIIGQHPSEFGSRDDLRAEFGYDDGRLTCIVSVGGSGVGANLIGRILSAYPMAKARLPDLRMIVVTGPRLDPAAFTVPGGVEMRAFVPNLDRHLAACDLALVQGGLTTCMELTAAGTPFLYFPLRNHFEQNFHVASRLDRYNAGRMMIYAQSDPDRIAEAMVEELSAPRVPHPVAKGGATKAARMLSELL